VKRYYLLPSSAAARMQRWIRKCKMAIVYTLWRCHLWLEGCVSRLGACCGPLPRCTSWPKTPCQSARPLQQQYQRQAEHNVIVLVVIIVFVATRLQRGANTPAEATSVDATTADGATADVTTAAAATVRLQLAMLQPVREPVAAGLFTLHWSAIRYISSSFECCPSHIRYHSRHTRTPPETLRNAP
jgi:hypothetical protein